LTRSARKVGVPVLVDAQKSLLLNALAERPFIVKPNLDGATAAFGLTFDDGEAGALEAVSALVEAEARWALVTRGADGALLGDESGQRWRIEPPRHRAVNPIGSGDALTGGLLHALARGKSVPEAAVLGTACAATNALTRTSGAFGTDEAERLLPGVRLTRLS